MSSAVPSRLACISDLPNLDVGDKVRFLGCVEEYEISTGTLYLTHNVPPTPSDNQVFALVNVDHVLESVKSTDLEVGVWVNVIGYVAPAAAAASKTQTVPVQAERRSKRNTASQRSVYVQAIMLWSAGAIKLDEYEKALQMRKAVKWK